MELNRIYNSDCLGNEGMRLIPDKSINMILCDLPYGQTKNKWDSVLPLDALWSEYKRIITDNGVIVLFGQGMFTAQLMSSNQQMWKYNLIWDKVLPSGHLNAKKMPMRSHEDIVVFSPDSDHEDILVFYKKAPSYSPIMEKGEPNHGEGRKIGQVKNGNSNYGSYKSVQARQDGLKYPKSILRFPKPASTVALHPTEKSLELCEYLITTYTNNGDVVLDNTAGSGTTCVACININRQFIAFEWNEENPTEYYDKAVKRIATASVNKN